LPLCLLTSETQNRRIVEALLRGAGGNPQVTLEADSITVLLGHVRTGAWATIVPERLLKWAGLSGEFTAVPLVDPEVVHTIGLVMPVREPMTPLADALATEARRAAARIRA